MSRPRIRWAALGAVGFEFAISVVVGLWLGLKADEWLKIGPFGVVLGIFAGLGTAVHRLWVFVRMIQRTERDEEQARHRSSPESGGRDR